LYREFHWDISTYVYRVPCFGSSSQVFFLFPLLLKMSLAGFNVPYLYRCKKHTNHIALFIFIKNMWWLNKEEYEAS
jgi:hypothetical protein